MRVNMKIKTNQSLDVCLLDYLDGEISLCIIFDDLFPIFSKWYFSKMFGKTEQNERNLDLFVKSVNFSEWHLQLLMIELFEEGNQTLLFIFHVTQLNSKHRVDDNHYWGNKQLLTLGLFYFAQTHAVHVLLGLVQYYHV